MKEEVAKNLTIYKITTKKQNLPHLALETYFLQFSLCTQNCGHENKKAKAVTPPQSFKNIFKFLSIQISIVLKIV